MNKMELQFTSMASLLTAGHHKMIATHFGCSDFMESQIKTVAEELVKHTQRLAVKMHETGDMGLLCECHLLKTAFALMDEHVKPVTVAEIAYVTYLTSRIMDGLNSYVAQQQQLVRRKAQQTLIPKFSDN